MDVKIAVASSDGINVDQHFGRAVSFLIYRLVDNGCEFCETRGSSAACSGQFHDDAALEKTVTTLRDCKAVVVAQIGPGAMDMLIYHRIMPFTLPGPIEDAFAIVRKNKAICR